MLKKYELFYLIGDIMINHFYLNLLTIKRELMFHEIIIIDVLIANMANLSVQEICF